VLYAAPRLPSEHDRSVVDMMSHLASIAIGRDRTRRRLDHEARHDRLTGLPNRSAVVEHLRTAMEAAPSEGGHAVLLVGLDRFRTVNETWGHEAGDDVLATFGDRLRGLADDASLVGHLGGDEFVVVTDDASDQRLRQLVARLEQVLDEPFAISHPSSRGVHAVHLTASIGVAHTTGAASPHELLQQADAAACRARSRGRGRCEVFDGRTRSWSMDVLRVDRELRMAVERHELVLHYQPKVDLARGCVTGVEALMRWRHPERGFVGPAEFIGIAEETGVIARIGSWVLFEAVRQARSWVDRLELDRFSVAVNVSARQLSERGFLDDVARALDERRWPAEWLTLELTESVLVDEDDDSVVMLEDLKGLGVRLAIDDFGTGYSSLSYLHRFPVDVVKVDRAFVGPLDDHGGGSPIVAAVTQMAHALGLRVAAEGVERRAQLDGLRALGVELGQGYLFSAPLEPGDLAALLRAQPRW
jgi:diguanylate cyclase (GGDEF)-like protein